MNVKNISIIFSKKYSFQILKWYERPTINFHAINHTYFQTIHFILVLNNFWKENLVWEMKKKFREVRKNEMEYHQESQEKLYL